MPSSLEGHHRPAAALQGDRPAEDPAFDAAEALYRRCPPDCVHEWSAGRFRVITAAWAEGICNLSTVRGKYGEPDHARWDSEYDPHNPHPMLYRDFWVVKISVADIPEELTSSGGVTFQFAPIHRPYPDLYGHSEIVTKKHGQHITSTSKINKRVLTDYLALLADNSRVVLRPDQIEPDGDHA